MHPYRNAPSRSFWTRAVASDYDASAVRDHTAPLVGVDDRVASAGSCFAANMIPVLQGAGIHYLRTEAMPKALGDIPAENLGYPNFSAAYGNLYTARQLLQLLQRCLGQFKPVEDRWPTATGVVDPFRPGLRYHARSEREFDLLTAAHLRAVRAVFEQATVFIFTLGLTEAWCSTADGAVYPACPGTVAGEFDPQRHRLINFRVDEVIADLGAVIELARTINPTLRWVLTVSPVPLVATATGRHVLTASTYSKAVLRVAADDIVRRYEAVEYFPALEIITGPQAPADYFQPDRRNVSPIGVAAVMDAFLAACDGSRRRADRGSVAPPASSAESRLSRWIADVECEEAAVDPGKSAG